MTSKPLTARVTARYVTSYRRAEETGDTATCDRIMTALMLGGREKIARDLGMDTALRTLRAQGQLDSDWHLV